MKKPMRWLGLPLVALLAACPGEAVEDDLGLDEGTVPSATEVTPSPAAPIDAQPGMTETVEIEGLQDSGVSGTATVTGSGDQTEVMVRLAGAPANSTAMGHIHAGTCEALGGVVQPLEEISIDATGNGEMTAMVDLPAMTAMDGEHIVVYHGDGGTPIACAAIPQHMM